MIVGRINETLHLVHEPELMSLKNLLVRQPLSLSRVRGPSDSSETVPKVVTKGLTPVRLEVRPATKTVPLVGII